MPKIQDIKVFTGATVNLDVDDKVLKNNMFREIYNMIFDKFSAHYYPGNTLRSNSFIGGSAIFMGGCRDVKRNAYVIHIRQTYDEDMILWYFPATKTFQKILSSSLLNYQIGYPVSSEVVGDLLYWTDGWEYNDERYKFQQTFRNPPRKINIIKASNYLQKPYYNISLGYFNEYQSYDEGAFVLSENLSGTVNIYQAKQPYSYTDETPSGTTLTNDFWTFIETYDYRDSYLQPITERVIDRIKYPPIYPPELLDKKYASSGSNILYFINGYSTDPAVSTNNLRKNLLYFSYRYIYDDGEPSCWSEVSRLPIPSLEEFSFGAEVHNPSLNNVVGFTIDLGPEEVKYIEIACGNPDSKIWKLVDRIFKYNEYGNIIKELRSNYDYNYLFYNNVFSEGIDIEDFFRIYDYVPQISSRLELIEDNRILDADIIEGYDLINPDVSLKISYNWCDFRNLVDYLGVTDGQDYWIITISINIVPGKIISIKFKMVLNLINGNSEDQPYRYVYYSIKEGDTYESIVGGVILAIKNEFGQNYMGQYWDVSEVDGVYNQLKMSKKFTWQYFDELDFLFELEVVDVVSCLAVIDPGVTPTIKSGSYINVALQYYDRGNRSGSVVRKNNMRVYVPTFNYNHVHSLFNTPGYGLDRIGLHQAILDWEINHKPPLWAESYGFMVSKSNISWFCDYFFSSADIVKIDQKVKININSSIKKLVDFKNSNYTQYYSWEKGDRVRFLMKKYDSDPPNPNLFYCYLDSVLDFEITGVEYEPYTEDNHAGPYKTDGDPESGFDWAYVMDENGNKIYDPSKQYIILEDFDIDAIADMITKSELETFIIEIYRVSKEIADSENIFYYPTGDRYEIINPHTEYAVHGKGKYINTTSQDQQLTSSGQPLNPATGQFIGGEMAFIRARFDGEHAYPIEDMNISDFYSSKPNLISRVAVVDRNMRRQKMISAMRFSGKYFESTLVNNLSRVEWDAIEILPEKFGAIIMIKQIGYTLRIKQLQKMTSIYIGREGLMQASQEGQDIVATSNNVLGAKITSENSYGLSTSQAYCTNGKDEYFVDILNGVIVRNSTNGPFPISDYGIKEWVKDECNFLLNTCSNYRIFAAYDGYHDYVLFMFAGLNGRSWDIHTWVFSEAENAWKGKLDLDYNDLPIDGFLHDGMDLFGFYNGQLYTFNDGDPLEFFGTKRVPSIKMVANAEPFLVKLFKSISVYSSKIWYAKEYGDIAVPISINQKLGMRSKLPAAQFESMEGIHRAGFMANSRSTKTTDNVIDLVNGQELRGETMEITLTCDERDEDILLTGITIDALHSKRSGE